MPVSARLPDERRAPARLAAGGEPPPRRRRARLAFHGVRCGVLLAAALLLHLLFPGGAAPGPVVLERGTVAPADVIARIPFQLDKTPEELRREQDEAARGVPVVYDYAPRAAPQMVAALERFFAAARTAAGAPPPARSAELTRLMAASGIPAPPPAAALLGDTARSAALLRATVRAVRDQLPRGMVSVSPARAGVSTVRVRGLSRGGVLLPADSVLTADQLFHAAERNLPPGAGADAAELQRLLLVRWFVPSLALNGPETEAARARARAAVDPVRYRVLPGERVVAAHEQVSAEGEERLRAYQAALSRSPGGARPAESLARNAGSVLFNLLLLGILGFLLRFSRPHLYADLRSVAFLGALLVVVGAVAALIARLGLPPELVPVPFAALVVAVLWGGRLALAVALVLALLLGGQPPFLGVAVSFTAALGGAAAAFGVRVAQRRLQTWMVVGIIAAAYASAALAVGLLHAWTPREIAWSVLWGALNATGSSLLAVGLVPVAEWATRVTTNQTLQELADPKHPLLQRLSLEAPGTYAHTISVANLAEAVCNAIGANALLARVGVYYHDIGKVVKPQYFIENQPRGRNPHDRLKPATSAAIVRSHVAEGLRLAEQHRLPDAVKAFIAQHHGTQPISFFLQQAKDSDPAARVEARDFAYHGPRPQTRETAVVMLADAVESATRVLPDPTPERIRELVDRIVNAKVAAGQLDQSPLTLREVSRARDVLARALASMYHHRVEYPAASDPAPASAEDGATPATGSAQPRDAVQAETAPPAASLGAGGEGR